MSGAGETAFFGQAATYWPVVPVLTRLGLAVAIGVFIGLEREHNKKTGVRTFALVALLGCLGGLLGPLYVAIASVYIALLVGLMNWRKMAATGKIALTTSTALMLVGFAGVMCGMGHVFAPVAAAVMTAALLAWKQPIRGFVGAIEDKEVRSAILLAILTFVILPVLPTAAVDPWGLVQPRENWASVVIIAAIGFVNYVLLKVLGPRGMEVTAFFGGLVNSRKVIVELMGRMREMGASAAPSVYRGIMLATASMVLRNAIVVVVFASGAMVGLAIPFTMMLLVILALWRWLPAAAAPEGEAAPTIKLESPFKLSSALKFGALFLAINVAGGLAQREFGAASFYFISVLGALVSSASAIAAAANLIGHHDISVATGVNGIILASLTSIVSNIPLAQAMTRNGPLRRRLSASLAAVAVVGLLGAGINHFVLIPPQ